MMDFEISYPIWNTKYMFIKSSVDKFKCKFKLVFSFSRARYSNKRSLEREEFICLKDYEPILNFVAY